jgi:hypothetical protein
MGKHVMVTSSMASADRGKSNPPTQNGEKIAKTSSGGVTAQPEPFPHMG